MGGITLLLLIIILIAILITFTVKAVVFFERFNTESYYLKMEMKRAEKDEYDYWLKVLRCHYLRLIPFVTPKNVEYLYFRIYHKPKHNSEKIKTDGLYNLLMPSIIGIVICSVCLCGVSWAWFTSTQSSNIGTVTFATYTAEVTAKKVVENGEKTNEDITVKLLNDGTSEIKIEADCKYEITVFVKGTAKTGYCKIGFSNPEFEKTTYYTSPIIPNNTLTFYFVSDKNCDLLITPEWGTCSYTTTIPNGTTINFNTEKS